MITVRLTNHSTYDIIIGCLLVGNLEHDAVSWKDYRKLLINGSYSESIDKKIT